MCSIGWRRRPNCPQNANSLELPANCFGGASGGANPLETKRLTYRRTNHKNFHVWGFKEEARTSTPFDMVVMMHDLNHFYLVADVIYRAPALGSRAAYAKQAIRAKFIKHKQYIAAHGEDLLEIRNWKWSNPK